MHSNIIKKKVPLNNVALEKQIDIDHIKALIFKHKGNLSRVADTLGVARCTVNECCKRNPTLYDAIEDARMRMIEEVELSVFARAAEGTDTALQCFVLKTQGRNRGWDQDNNKDAAKDIATAAFEFIVNKSKNPAEPYKQPLAISKTD